jgi:protocatechuate 3,4-dioxygenase beta subunit
MTFTFRTWRMALAILGLALLQPGGARAAQSQDPRPQEGSRASQTFKITGTVVSATTGAPLSQARIYVAETRDRGRAVSMVTSEDGHFEFSQLKAGKYSLQGAKRGFISSAYEQHEQFSTAIVTGPEFSTENLVLRLTPMALITGHVFDEFGDPVRSAQVVLYFENHGAGMSRITRFSNATSDDRGFFDFSLLRPGKYYISATAKPWYAIHPETASGAASSPASQISPALDVAYPTTYFNGATEADTATPIEVKGGDRLELDMHLNPVPALHLIFRIPENVPGQTNGTQMPVLQKHVFDSVEYVQSDGMRPVGPGVYELTGVAAGRYTVRAKNSDSGRLEQSADVDLVRDGQELNESRGESLGSLKLSLKMPGVESLPKQYVVGLQDSRRRMEAVKQGGPTGQFTFEDLAPGRYAILIGSQTRPYSVVRTSSPAGDSAGHDVNITPGAAIELTASLSAGVVSIEGVVHKKGKPLAGIMVALVPNDPVAHVDLFRRDQSDFDGTFVLRGVIPGSYTIVAVEDAWGLEWLQPSVLARYVQHGQNLTIGELMRGTVSLPDPIEVQPH